MSFVLREFTKKSQKAEVFEGEGTDDEEVEEDHLVKDQLPQEELEG
jgi:hypothetical protein